ncbi:MAG: dTDP-4-dehydrorhamnose 3,5-epimerase [Nitrosomonadales bacterium]|nr:dTDP-4-dehydrorhamnose 3,5-epimerase [Nitrosomonadales bacterium]
MSRFSFLNTSIAGLKVVQRKPIEDDRGFLSRFFCAEEFEKHQFNKPISQINHTLTRKKGVVRGLHYQNPPFAEMKLVSCLKGEVFDVAVDLRIGSPTFLQWHAEILSAGNSSSLLIPEGFAHGFQTLTDNCELIYLHTAPYAKEAEGALNANDKQLSIKWPLQIAEMSDRDRAHPMISIDFRGLAV